MAIKILFLPKYTSKAASSRYRTYQYLNYFCEAGLIVNVKPLFNDKYINDLYTNKTRGLINIFVCYLKRIYYLITSSRYDVVYIEKEALPYIPYVIEKLFLPLFYILDYDDAVFHTYTNNKIGLIKYSLSNKISNLMINASAIVTGSPYLTSYAKRYNQKIYEFPTSVNWERYNVLPDVDDVSNAYTIGWIGSPSTSKYLLKIIKPLKRFMEEHNNVLVKLVGFDNTISLDLDKERLTIINWSGEDEIKAVCNFDVGIMPLDDDLFSKGKCGFKLIQYMACGIPTISTPLEANLKINEGSDNLFAETEEEWFCCFEKIFQNKDQYKKVGKINRDLAFQKFSLQSNLQSYVNLLKNFNRTL